MAISFYFTKFHQPTQNRLKLLFNYIIKNNFSQPLSSPVQKENKSMRRHSNREIKNSKEPMQETNQQSEYQ